MPPATCGLSQRARVGLPDTHTVQPCAWHCRPSVRSQQAAQAVARPRGWSRGGKAPTWPGRRALPRWVRPWCCASAARNQQGSWCCEAGPWRGALGAVGRGGMGMGRARCHREPCHGDRRRAMGTGTMPWGQAPCRAGSAGCPSPSRALAGGLQQGGRLPEAIPMLVGELQRVDAPGLSSRPGRVSTKDSKSLRDPGRIAKPALAEGGRRGRVGDGASSPGSRRGDEQPAASTSRGADTWPGTTARLRGRY